MGADGWHVHFEHMEKLLGMLITWMHGMFEISEAGGRTWVTVLQVINF